MKPYKRFLLFIWEEYEEAGGLKDVKSSHDTLEKALKEGRSQTGECDWFEIFDCQERVVAHEQEKGTTPYEQIKGTAEYRRAHPQRN